MGTIPKLDIFGVSGIKAEANLSPDAGWVTLTFCQHSSLDPSEQKVFNVTCFFMASDGHTELAQAFADAINGVGAAAAEPPLAEQPMPWCDRCQCYHHDTAEHISVAASAPINHEDIF